MTQVFIPSFLDDYGLDPYEFRVYCRIARRESSNKGCFESHASMARDCRITERKVRDAIDLLVAANLIDRTVRRGMSYVYTMTDRERWVDSAKLEEIRTSVQRKDRRARKKNTPVGSNTPTPVGSNTPTPVGSNTPTPVGSNTPTPVGSNTPTPVGSARLPLSDPTDEGNPLRKSKEGSPFKVLPPTPQKENDREEERKELESKEEDFESFFDFMDRMEEEAIEKENQPDRDSSLRCQPVKKAVTTAIDEQPLEKEDSAAPADLRSDCEKFEAGFKPVEMKPWRVSRRQNDYDRGFCEFLCTELKYTSYYAQKGSVYFGDACGWISMRERDGREYQVASKWESYQEQIERSRQSIAIRNAIDTPEETYGLLIKDMSPEEKQPYLDRLAEMSRQLKAATARQYAQQKHRIPV